MEGTMYDLIVAFGKCIADTCYDNLIVALANGDRRTTVAGILPILFTR